VKTYISKSPEETKKFAMDLANKFPKGVIALSGELGSGKTTFVQGFAEGLGIKEKIISPTFVLIRQHPIPKTKKNLPAGRQALFHIDLYRLESVDVEILGIDEIIRNPNNIVLIEWAEKIKHLLPKNTYWILLEVVEDNTRTITEVVRFNDSNH